MSADICPACGKRSEQRVGVKIAGVWRYCWICECGERWGWVNEAEDKRKESND